MKIPDIIEELRRLDIGIKVKNGQLVLSGSKNKLPDDLLNEIRENKQGLIDYIKNFDNDLNVNETIAQNSDGYYPLTAQQKSIWLASQNNNTVILYNQPSIFTAKGMLNINALEYSINKIIIKHDSLRTVFDEIDGEPLQKVVNNIKVIIDYKELGSSENIIDIYKKFSKYVFNLSKPPLLKCMIVKVNNNEHYLLFNIHHIISDGWSVNIFFNELLENYSLYLHNGDRGDELINSRVHFKEFVDFQNRYIESDNGKADLDFWKEKLGLDYSSTKLSSKTDYEGFEYYDGDYSNFYLPEVIQSNINNFCKSKKVTPFHFYSAVLTLLLRRYTGNKTISFGTPFACRSDAKYNNVIGCFINTLPIIINSENAVTFEDLLISISSEITEVYNHQNYPAENIIENIILPKVSGGTPLFDIMIMYQNYSLNSLFLDDLKLSYFQAPIEKSKAGLVFRVFEEDTRILLNIEFSKKLFDSLYIERIFEHFKTIVKNILINPCAVLNDIKYLPGHERNELINLLDNSKVNYPKDKTVLDYLNHQFKQRKDKIALILGGKNITYGELEKKSNILANYLIKNLKIGPNEIIGIMTGRNENLIIGIIAVLKTGAAYLPINPEYPAERKQLMLDDSGCKLLLSDFEIEDISYKYLSINNILKNEKFEGVDLTADLRIPQSSPAYIIYTSGSTGRPKGVIIDHKNILRLYFNDKQMFDFNENDIWTLFHSSSFDLSVWEIFGALLFGGKLVVVPEHIIKDPSAFYNILADEKITVLTQTPSAFYRLTNDADKKLSLRYIIFAGEALQPDKLKDWAPQYPSLKFINMYGITETTVHVTYKDILLEDIRTGLSNVGKPLPTLGIVLLDDDLSLVPKGIPGQICVYGEGLAQGYLNRPELTSEKFRNITQFGLCYLSGDLARMLENGDIEYLGRMDDQVQFHGFRIELSEIERALISIEGIKEAIVLADGKNSEISLNAFLIFEKEKTIGFIRRELAKKIPAYMIPSTFVFIDAVPLTVNGKTDKKALIKLKSLESKIIIEPENEIEKRILEAWKAVLGVIRISTDESFFAIGGDSIKALKLVREINKNVNIRLTIAELYENDTIKKLAKKEICEADTNSENGIRNELTRIENRSKELVIKNDLSKSIEQIIPMSDIQRGMIYYSKKNPVSSIYHDQFVYPIYLKGFSFEVLNRSFELMIEKHPMMRTSFNMLDYSEDVQLVHKNVQPDLRYEDLSEKDKDSVENIISNYISTERTLKFEISIPPLWRMKIFKASDNIIIICWSFHHALLDGWSNASFMTELLSVYKNLLNNSEYKPELLKGSYLDYVAEQNINKNDSNIINFWKNELSDYKRLELPKKGPDTIELTDDEYLLQIESELIGTLKKIALDIGTDIKTIFFSAYLYSMSLFTYDNDLLVGIITNNRPVIEDTEKILGCFLNTLPFRLSIDHEQTWKEFILSVYSKLNLLKKYEVMSLFEIVRHIGIPIGDSNPLVDVFFNYVDFNIYGNIYDEYSLDAHEIKEFNLNGYEKTNMAMNFTIANSFNRFSLKIIYDKEKISSKWVKYLGDNFKRLLYLIAGEVNEEIANQFQPIRKNVSDNTRSLLKDISFVDKSDVENLAGYNNTKRQFTEKLFTVPYLYDEQLEKNKNKIGILFSDDSKPPVDYSVYNINVTKLAAKIVSKTNKKQGRLIGVITERNEYFLYAVMAIIKSGNGYVPVDPNFPEERAKFIINDCGCSIILCENKFEEYISKNYSGEIIAIEKTLEENLPPEEIIFPHAAESDPLFLLYTSGSTGKPKGVLMPHKPVVNLFIWMRNEYPVENERILLINPITFDMSTWGVFGWAMNGSSVCILKQGDEKDPAKIVKAVLEKSITSFHIVPSIFAAFLEYIEKHSIDMTNTKLRYIFVAGEVLLKHLIDKFNKCFKGSKTELVNLYGPTEAHIATHFAAKGINDELHTTVPIGKPIANAKILIVDKEMRIVPQGIIGEILLGGDCIADGYLNQTALTKEKFIILENELTDGSERFYRTGDIGRWLSDGNIEFFGRNDFQIKIRGFRVEPDEVQSIINGINGVKESLVIGREIIPGDKSLIAYVVYDDKDKHDESFIRNELKKQVADYMIPSIFVGIERFPLSPNGKIDRKSLPEPKLSEKGKSIITPRNKLEKRIAEIWSTALNNSSIGINDNFFDLGGHSLLMIRVHSEIEKEIDKQIEITDLFRFPTIASLTEFIKGGNNNIIDKAVKRAEDQKKARESRLTGSKRKGRTDE